MLLTKRNEYALQAMILLARQKPGNPLTAAGLARDMKTTPAFMSKIAQQLSGAGLIKSRRGKGGGLYLARGPYRIAVREIFGAVDGKLSVSACINQGCCMHHTCPIYPVLNRVQKELDQKLNSVKLATFVSKKIPSGY
jgi:Rrf2 family iron-sulfur cluster assembly transcriptional regulator